MTSGRSPLYLLETHEGVSDPLEDDVRFYSPATEHEALELRSRFGSRAKALAGGTDLLVSVRVSGWPEALISLRHLGWAEIVHQEDTITIGATTTAAVIVRELRDSLPLLADAASWLGGPQVRNRATIGGNLANGSPAADMALCLLVLDAQVELTSARGMRRIPVGEFMRGPKATAIEDDELLRAVIVPAPSASSRTWFMKVGPRSRHFVSRVAVAGLLVPQQRGIGVRIGLGAVAPTPIRAHHAECFAEAHPTLTAAEIDEVSYLAAQECHPIDDIRASEEYRRHIVRTLVSRFLCEVTA